MDRTVILSCFVVVACFLCHQTLCAPTPSSSAGSEESPEGGGVNHTQPATCMVAGTEYSHGYQIPRADPCELCLCLDGELFCWWQDCPSASPACRESPAYAACADNTTIQLPGNEDDAATDGTSEAAALTTSEVPLAENSSNALASPTSSGSATENSGAATEPTATVCRVMGTEYKIGEVLPRDTGTCLECVCDSEARVTCSPKDCASHDEFHASNNLDMFDVDTF